jgi:sulfite reductase (NADPH) flavoprotein alpha-component
MWMKLWFQTHWLLGITAGTVLALMGVTGAVLSFERELLLWLNPDVMTVTPRAEGPLPLHELLARVQTAYPDKRLLSIELSAEPRTAVRVGFATAASVQNSQGGANVEGGQRRREGAAGGGRRSERRYVDPYTGAVLGEPRGQEFFRLTMEIHRWLAAGAVGKAVTGVSTLALVVLCLSGLYLRWPQQVGDWRAWLKFDFMVTGRRFLRRLHAVAGTWVLLLYLLAGLTGLYWSYEWYRNGLLALTGAPPPNRERVTLDQPVTDRPSCVRAARSARRM